MPKDILISVHDLELYINLGWRKKERRLEQSILLDLDICLPKPPKACKTDDLADTICYAKIIENLRQQLHEKTYKLIEHLSQDIFDIIKPQLPKQAKLKVRITKYPNIKGLLGGVSFYYGDR